MKLKKSFFAFIAALLCAGLITTTSTSKASAASSEEALPSLFDQLIPPGEEPPHRVILFDGSLFLGDSLLVTLSMIPAVKSKYGNDCEIILLSRWAKEVKPTHHVIPIEIAQMIWDAPGLIKLLTSYVQSPTDLLFMSSYLLEFSRGLEVFRFRNEMRKFPARALMMEGMYLATASTGNSRTRTIISSTTERPSPPAGDAYDNGLLNSKRHIVSKTLLFSDSDMKPYLQDSLSPELFYEKQFGELRIERGEPFILINLHGGFDKNIYTAKYTELMIQIINSVRIEFPTHKILVTSPQHRAGWQRSPARPAPKNGFEVIRDIFLSRSSLYPPGLAPLPDFLANSLEELDYFIAQQNVSEKRIGVLHYNDIPALSRAIEDAKLIISQDTGLVHMAYQRRNLIRPDAKPEVLTLAFEDKTKWIMNYQPSIAPFDLNLKGQGLPLESVETLNTALKQIKESQKFFSPLNKPPPVPVEHRRPHSPELNACLF